MQKTKFHQEKAKTRKFIAIVKEYPNVWDVKHPDFFDAVAQKATWDEICRRTVQNWERLGATKKKETNLSIRKRWSAIKNVFKKDFLHWKHMKNLPAEERPRRYTYAEDLTFLEPMFDSLNFHMKEETFAEEEETATSDDSEESNNNTAATTTKQAAVLKAIETNNVVAPPPANHHTPPIPPQFLPDRTLHDLDDDTNFLLSLRSEMRKLDERKKLDLKIGMLTLVKNLTQTTNYLTPSTSYESGNVNQRMEPPIFDEAIVVKDEF